MALNLATFKTRALTALIFVVVMLAGLLVNQTTFFLLFSVIHFGCWFEYQSLMGKIDPEYKKITGFHRYGVMLAGWCLLWFFTNDEMQLVGIRMHALGWWAGLLLLFTLPILELLFSQQLSSKNITRSALGMVYISLSWGLMMDLYSHHWNFSVEGKLIPLVLIASIWVNDTMQYLVGSFIGRTPFSSISPKKTWEGTLGGSLLAVVIVPFAMQWIAGGHTYYWLGISAIAAVIGTLGDLLESKIKRMAQVKDSGSFMPGHVGFLDRFDSLILATPIAWLFTLLFDHFYK